MSKADAKTQGTIVRTYGTYFPNNDDAILMREYSAATRRGKMKVTIDISMAGVTHVVADTIPVVTDGPAVPTGTAVNIPLTATANRYELTDFWVNDLGPAGPFDMNKKLCYWGLNDLDRVVELGVPVRFAAVPNPCTGTVLATHLIWLTYADPGKQVAMFGEHTRAGSEFIPWGVRIPETARQVVVTPDGGIWNHDPVMTEQSGAMGQATGTQNLNAAHMDKYRNADLRSLHIIGRPLALNRLVGLLEYDDYNTDTTEIDIGTSGTPIPVDPSTQRRLRLAMHDGFEWSNNHGSVNVTLTWS